MYSVIILVVVIRLNARRIVSRSAYLISTVKWFGRGERSEWPCKVGIRGSADACDAVLRSGGQWIAMWYEALLKRSVPRFVDLNVASEVRIPFC